MVENFIERYAKTISSYSDYISVERNDVDDSFSEIIIHAKKEDAGKLIGKDGKMISSMKTMISGCKAKENRSYRIIVKILDEN